MVGAVRTTKPATQNDLPAPSGHHHCPQESTFCAPQPHARPLGHLLAITKSLAAQPLEAPCKQTTPRRARFDSAPKRQVVCKGSAQGTGCLLGRGSRDKARKEISDERRREHQRQEQGPRTSSRRQAHESSPKTAPQPAKVPSQ